MEFQTPTSREEMYEILHEIFYHYRFRPIVYEPKELDKIELPRMEYQTPTEEQFVENATKRLSGKHLREISEKEKELDKEILEKQIQYDKIDLNTESLMAKIRALYEENAKRVQNETVKRGVGYSDIILEKISNVYLERDEKILSLLTSASQEKTALESQINALKAQKNGLNEFFAPVHAKEIEQMVIELKENEQKVSREVFEYNNELFRKEQTYANSLISQNAHLELSYIEIRSKGYSKDELIEMGYYNAVMKCVNDYYGTLNAVTAYNEFSQDTKVIVYLEDYYEEMLYLYKIRANAT